MSVDATLLSVQNMLSDPNENSPANIDAAVGISLSPQPRDNGSQIKRLSVNASGKR